MKTIKEKTKTEVKMASVFLMFDFRAIEINVR